MRLGMALTALLWLVHTSGALAANQDTMRILGEYFAKQGEVQSSVYPPISGAELGAAVIAPKPAGEGASKAPPQLIVARLAGRNDVQQVLAESLPAADGKPQFALLMNGKHLLTYPTTEWKDAAGTVHLRGDLKIRDLEAEGGIKVLYELKDAVDLMLPAGSVQYSDCLLWQPQQHFLNARGVLPVRHNYVQLSFIPAKNEYALYQHLTSLPDAGAVESANLNNRALIYYRLGDLGEAGRLLEQAFALAEDDQSVIAHNQELVKSEIGELGRQFSRVEGRASDRSLMYFWQGDFAACLGELAPRQQSGLSDLDCAMAGLAMAHEKRWRDVDKVSIDLERRKAPFLAEYIGQLVQIADMQGYPDIASPYMKALATIGAGSPVYATLYAEALERRGKALDAEKVLEQYLAAHPGGSVNAQPRLKLYELYTRRGNTASCAQLEKDALAAPVTDLLGYVQLADYFDLSAARVPVRTDDNGIQAPNKPLDVFGIN
jgi:hypothetical protein